MAECGGIYAEDIVKNSQGTFGLVLQDAEETSDESDSEDEALKKGQIVVCWYPSGKEETLSVSKVKLADRSLLPGDVVKFANPQKGRQKGFISDVAVIGAIKVLTANRILYNVDCKELQPLQELISGVHVTMGPWLGMVQEAHQRVVLRLKSGARCSLEGEQCTMLYDLSDQRDEDSPFYSAAFYPGQMIAGPSRVFKEAKWLSGLKPVMSNNAQVKAVVEEAEVVDCEVNWQVCGTSQHDSPDSMEKCIKPPEALVAKDQLSRLKVVNHFQHASIQIGDKAFYTVKARDISEPMEQRNSNSSSSGKMLPKKNADEKMDDTEMNSCGEAGAEEASVGDNLSNAAVDSRTDTCTLGGHSNGAEKLSKDLDESKSVTDSKGIEAARCNRRERRAKGSCAAGKTREEGSVYSVIQSREQDKEAGEVQQEDEHDHTGISDSGDADEDSDGGGAVVPKTKGAGSGCPKSDSLSASLVRYPVKRRKKRTRRKRKAAPQIKVQAGDTVCVEVVSTYTTVDVTWQDSSKTKGLLSTDLLPVFHLDELEFFPGDYVTDKRDKASSASTPAAYGVVLNTDHDSRTCQVKWFTREGMELSQECDVSVYDITEHADFVFNAGDVVVRVAMDDTAISTEMKERNSWPCVGQVAIVDEHGSVQIKWVDRTISNVKPQELYKVDPEDDNLSNDSTFGSDDDWETASDIDSNESAGDDVNDHVIMGYSSPDPENAGDEETENVDEEVPSDVNNRVNELLSHKNPNFLILESVPEEHACKGSPFQPDNPRKFMSCVKREMALLQTSLPPGILVRGYEDRMDLWSVQITGPIGTPYEHGLFVFHVRLPPDYPASPPVFHYLSQCSGRLNPNLYDDGKVCVSLLGTWTGKGNETWTAKSNLLQVLLSIQGLILCREPYFNEAGYEKQRGSVEGRENSRLYNEMVLLKLLQSMQRLLTKPPASFKNEILLHFAHHGSKVVEKFQSWIDHFHSCAQVAHDSQQETDHVVETAELSQKHSANLEAVNVVSLNSQQSDTVNVDISERERNEDVTMSEESIGAAASTMCIPDYPLFPLSKGFCMSLKRCLDAFKTVLQKAQLSESAECTVDTAAGYS